MNGSSPPESFHCPITADVMTDPVLALDGYTYERTAIEEHFRLCGPKSPMTNAMLPTDTLTPNRALKNTIENWKSATSKTATITEPSLQESTAASISSTNAFLDGAAALLDDQIQDALVQVFRTLIGSNNKMSVSKGLEITAVYTLGLSLLLRFPLKAFTTLLIFTLYGIFRMILSGEPSKYFGRIEYVIGVIVVFFAVERATQSFSIQIGEWISNTLMLLLIAWLPENLIKPFLSAIAKNELRSVTFCFFRVLTVYVLVCWRISSGHWFVCLINVLTVVPISMGASDIQSFNMTCTIERNRCLDEVFKFSQFTLWIIVMAASWNQMKLATFIWIFQHGMPLSDEASYCLPGLCYLECLRLQHQHVIPSLILLIECILGDRTSFGFLLSSVHSCLTWSPLTPSLLFLNVLISTVISFRTLGNGSLTSCAILISKFLTDWILWSLLVDDRRHPRPNYPGQPRMAVQPFTVGEKLLLIDHQQIQCKIVTCIAEARTSIKVRDKKWTNVTISFDEVSTRLRRLPCSI